MKEKYKQLDIIRFCGAVSIFMFHYYQCLAENDLSKMSFMGDFAWFGLYGFLAVEGFFILSGFLIAYNYKNVIFDMTFLEFVGKRIKKLWVPTTLSNILGFIVLFKQISFRGGGYTLLLNLTFTSTNWVHSEAVTFGGVTWFVNSLILCYVSYFVLMTLIKHQKQLYIPGCVFCMALGWGILVGSLKVPIFNFGKGCCCFFVGVLLNEINNCKSIRKDRIAITGMVVTGILFLLSMLYGIEYIMGDFRLMLVFFIYPVMILGLTNIKLFSRIFTNNICKWLGGISMPMFYIHYAILLALHYYIDIDYNNMLTFLIIFVCIVLLSIIFKKVTQLVSKVILKFYVY